MNRFIRNIIALSIDIITIKVRGDYTFLFKNIKSKSKRIKLLSLARQETKQTKKNESGEDIIKERKCSRCGDTSSKIEIFNNKPYCYICSAYYSSKFKVIDGKLIGKESGTILNKEVVLWEKPLHCCRGDIEPTCFVINIFADKVEIVWSVGWRGGTSHADGAGGTEIPTNSLQNSMEYTTFYKFKWVVIRKRNVFRVMTLNQLDSLVK